MHRSKISELWHLPDGRHKAQHQKRYGASIAAPVRRELKNSTSGFAPGPKR
jgi:hypothetical protein